MSQVKKLQQGTGPDGIQSQPQSLNFNIDGKDYKLDSQSGTDMFNPVFDQMKAAGVVKEKNREDYFKTFQQFQQQAQKGTYHIQSSGGKYLTGTYTGPDGANLGVNPDGSNAHKTGIGNIISPFSRDDHQRMALFNTYYGDNLIKKYNSDQAAAKAKADADLTKKNTDAANARTDYINRFEDYTTPNTAIYGKVGGKDPQWSVNKFWENSGKGIQDRVLQGTFGKIGNYLFNSQLDDPEAKKAFQDKYGVSVDDARNAFTSRGFANGVFGKGINNDDMQKLALDLQVGENYDPYFNHTKPTSEAAAKTAQESNLEANRKLQQQGYKFTSGGLTYSDADLKNLFTGKMEDGTYYKNGKIFSGIRFDNNGLTSDLENKDNGYYWQGKQTDKNTFYNNLGGSKDQNLINDVQAVNKEIDNTRNSQTGYFGSLKDINYNSDTHKGYDKDNSRDEFVFKDYLNKGLKIPKTAEISGAWSFSKTDPNSRLIAYEAPGMDRYGNEGVMRYRFVTPNGEIIDGNISKNLDGTSTLHGTNGRAVNLGFYERSGKSPDDDERFYRQGTKSNDKADNKAKDALTSLGEVAARGFGLSGLLNSVEKHQLGGNIGLQQKDDFTSAPVKGAFSTMSNADKVELAGIGSQILGVISGFVPGGSVASAGLGLAGTGAEYASNYMKHGFKWGDVLGAGGGVALDLLSSIPGAGEFAASAKLGKLVRGAATTLKAGFVASGAVAALGSLGKLEQGKDLNVDDWKNIAGGIQSMMAGKHMTDKALATEGSTQNTIKVNGEHVPISATAANAINNAKPGDKLSVAKDVLKDSGLDLDKIDLHDFTQRNTLNKATFGKFGSKTTDQVPTLATTTGSKLRDFGEANWLQRQAIKAYVARHPEIPGAENFSINGKSAAGPTTGYLDRLGSERNLNWTWNAAKMKYTPNGIQDPSELPQGSIYDPSISNSNKALPPSTGKTEGGTLFRTKDGSLISTLSRPGVREERTDEFAHMGPVYKSLEKLDSNNDSSVDNFINEINLAKPEGGGVTSAVNNDHSISELKSSLGLKDGEKVRRDVITNLFKDNMTLSAEQKATKDKFMNTKFEKGSAGDILQSKIRDAYTNPRRKGFVTFKKGGKVPKYQGSGVIRALNPNNPTLMGAVNFWNGNGDSDYLQNPSTDPLHIGNILKTVDNMYTPALQDKVNAEIKASSPVATTNPSSSQNMSVEDRSKPSPFSLAGLLPKNPNIPALSELGRALYTRQINSQIDTRVERPMSTAPTEVPVSIRGNMYGESLASDQANRLGQAAANSDISDPAIRAATMLDAQNKGAQLRQQANMQSIDMLNKTREANYQQQSQAAAQRAQIANENIHTNANATQAERQAQNEKLARMNQPILDFWKDRDAYAEQQRQQDRLYDTEIGMSNVQNAYSEAMRPAMQRTSELQMRNEELERKKLYGGGLSSNEELEFNNNQTELNNLYQKTWTMPNRLNSAQLYMRKYYGNWNLPQDYFKFASGGTVISNETRMKIQESKANEDNAKTTAKIQQENLKADQDAETKENLEAAKDIQQLILKALS